VDPYRAPLDELPLREYYPQERTRRRISGPRQASPPPPRDPGLGELVLERYRLLERLGAGGFGVVWRAHDELLDREVAVKRIPLGGDEESAERAGREAMACARLAHPSIVALYEACARDDAFYLISELVHGDTLARHISARDLSDGQALEIALAITAALQHAHERGVIHRDIKPQNVLVPEHGAVAAKLADFGGASLAGEDALTRTGDVLGTLAYMSPEQTEGREVGEEADLYSLALVLYESLAGTNPVRGPTPAATARRIGLPVPSLADARPDLPDALVDAVDRALEPEPEDRGSLEDLRAGVGETLSGERASLGRASLPPHLAPRDTAVMGRRPRAQAVDPALEPEGRDTAVGRRLSLPRTAWIALAGAAVGWQVIAGRPGVGLILLAALAPVLVLPRRRGSGRVGAGWLTCALAPALGAAGLAAAYPAAAGQARAWSDRAAYGALGYWWLVLAEPLLGRRLWLAPAAGTHAHDGWQASLPAAASHVLAPVLTVPVLLGAAVWAAGALLLPWLVRGRSAILDLLAAAAWSLAIALATLRVAGGLGAHASTVQPRGLLLGAVLGGLVAVAARALRGPV